MAWLGQYGPFLQLVLSLIVTFAPALSFLGTPPILARVPVLKEQGYLRTLVLGDRQYVILTS